MNKYLKYIAFYDKHNELKSNRKVYLSAVNKIDYITKVLNRDGYSVEIVSPAWTTNKYGIYKGELKEMIDGNKLRTFATIGTNNRIMKILGKYLMIYQLTLYLLKNTKRKETVIIYHSILFLIPIIILKVLKKTRIILELEEIYGDVQITNSKISFIENKIIKYADSYILSTELLRNKIYRRKPHVVIYGIYDTGLTIRKVIKNNNINVVYAGILDSRKGCLLAVAATEYLPSNYHVHIIGFGSQLQLEILFKKIEEISKRSIAKVSYDGLLSGSEFNEFIRNCDIGLSVQMPETEFNDSSFPSKVLTYLSNGLVVISTSLESIKTSSIGEYVYYLENYSPRALADAIINVDLSKKSRSLEVVKMLDSELGHKLSEIIEFKGKIN